MIVIFEILINLYQGFLMVFFMDKVLLQAKPLSKLYDVASVLCIGGYLCLCQFVPIGLPDTLTFAFPFFHAIVTRRGNWTQRVLWTLICAGVMNVVILLMTNLFMESAAVDTIMSPSSARVGYVISTNIVLTIALLLVARISSQRSSEFLDIPSFIALMVTFLLVFAATEFLYLYQMHSSADETLLLCVYICLLGLVVLTLLFYYIINHAARNRHMAEMHIKTLSLHGEHQHEMAAIYHDMLVMQHDMKHQVSAIKQMIQTSPNVDRDAIMELLKTSTPPSLLYMTGCTIVDAILTAKHAIMEQHQIRFTFQPYPLQQLPLDDTAFCILLSNLLDNAIEGVQRIEDLSTPKEITLSFARSWSMFYISCKNSVNPNTIHRVEDRFISSKDNKRLHGLGLESIRHIVAANNGVCDITTNNNQFCVDIVLPDKEEQHA